MNKNIVFTVSTITLLLSSCGKHTEESKPIRKDIAENVFASGILEADNSFTLTAQTDGYIAALYFKEGDVVEKGQLLATIENKEDVVQIAEASELLDAALSKTKSNAPLLQQAQKNIDVAKQQMSIDKDQAERYKRLLLSNSVSQSDYEKMELSYQASKSNYEIAVENYKDLRDNAMENVTTSRTQKQLKAIAASKNRISALLGGKVYSQFKKVGDYVRKGDAIATLGSKDLLYAKLNVDESSVGKIKLGQVANIRLNTSKDKTYKGVVNEILPSFDEANQSYTVKLKFTDVLDFNIIKTQLQANIVVDTRKNILLVPRNYVDYSNTVQVKGKDGRTKVQTNAYSNDYMEIVSGIGDNDVLVTENIVGDKK